MTFGSVPRTRFAAVGILPVLLAALASSALAPSAAVAQDLDRPLAYLQHSHWTQQQGLGASTLENLRRTPDGYLWIGSTSGLIRFDGFRFTVIERAAYAPVDLRAPTIYSQLDGAHVEAARRSRLGMVTPLLVDRDGVFWIADAEGSLIRYRDGAFTRVIAPDPRVGRINSLAQDGAGRYWAVGSVGDRLYAMRDSRLVAASVPPTLASARISGIVRDTADGVWIGTRTDGLWHVGSVGPPLHFVAPHADVETTPLLQTRDGTLWVRSGNTYRFQNGKWESFVPDAPLRLFSTAAVEMPDGAVVVALRGAGLVRWKDGAIDRLRESDGLSSESVQRLLLDEDGSLWATTDGGLDRFRAAAFATIGSRNGLPVASPASIQLDGDGDLWVMSSAGTGELQKLNRARLLSHRAAVTARVGRVGIDSFYAPFARLPGRGIILVDNHAHFARVEAGRIQPFGITGVPQTWENRPTSTFTARNGDIWFSFLRRGVGRARNGHYLPIVLEGLEQRPVAAMSEDGVGHVWIAMADTALILELKDGEVVRTIGSEHGVAEPMQLLVAGGDDTFWAAGATTGRAFRITNGEARAFTLPAFSTVMQGATPVLVPSGHELWFASSSGIGRIDCASLETDSTKAIQIFDAADGLTAGRLGRMLFGGAVTDPDGRIWFSTLDGLAVVSPALLRKNEKPPAVHIEEIRSGGRLLSRGDTRALRIEPNPERVDINFTATSLLIPERVRIEYQLVGADPAWIDGSATRLATYNHLPPGGYEFRVRAWNEDGFPSAKDASYRFSVLPAWYQTLWFRALAAILLIAAVSMGAAAQQKAKARGREKLMRGRFEATLEERARLAREMHDTLLSGFTGVTYQLHALQATIVPTPERAASRLTDIMESADEVIRDARRTIWDIRNHDADALDVVSMLERAARGAVEDTDIDIRLTVAGERRVLGAPLDAALLRIGREAVVNAVKHADPRTIDVELTYKAGGISLCVRDDGCGFIRTDVDDGVAAGHLGIAGMQERARALGGIVTVSSVVREGTTVLLTLPSETV